MNNTSPLQAGVSVNLKRFEDLDILLNFFYFYCRLIRESVHMLAEFGSDSAKMCTLLPICHNANVTFKESLMSNLIENDAKFLTSSLSFTNLRGRERPTLS